MAIAAVALVACGSSDTAVTPKDTAALVSVVADTTGSPESAEVEESQVVAPDPVDTTAETQAAALIPADTTAEASADVSTDVSTEITEMTVVDLTPVDDPDTLEALVTEADPEPESTESALLTSYTDYGFALKLDLGADVQTAGWTEAEASLTQGIIAFAYGGVFANLVWGPPEDRTALTFLADTYNVLRASQPTMTFESITDGDITISDQEGVYGGFKAIDDGGAAIGGGLIGAWICGDSDTAFRMTLTGEDATVVQLRFDRLLENFACSSS